METPERKAPSPSMPIDALTLRIAERARELAQARNLPPGCELALWLEAEAEVKRERHR